MKFGVREICDVVLKAKSAQKVGNKVFYKNEPVCYFDSLKTSSMESAATTVYAQGGRGNARLVAWEGERTVTFTMEDALISPIGFMILSGAGLIEASASKPIIMHTTEQTSNIERLNNQVSIVLSEKPYLGEDMEENNNVLNADNVVKIKEDFIYVMPLKNGEVISEPFIPSELAIRVSEEGKYIVTVYETETETTNSINSISLRYNDLTMFDDCDAVLVDYYTAKPSGAFQVDITPDKFGGNYYLEASTLFRDTNGVDMPAEFVIPNCKVQSNFTFTMASSGDPSTFTFTMDAFPDYTRWDKTKKVLAAIQVLNTGDLTREFIRYGNPHDISEGSIVSKDTNTTYDTVAALYEKEQKPFIEID